MSKTIIFVTGNKRKFGNCQKKMEGTGITVEQEALETIEIQSNNVSDVARFSAEDAGKQLNKPLIKVDVGFSIEALNGFPGPYIKHINKWLSPEDILKLMSGQENRKCYFEDVIALYIPGQEVMLFSDKTEGTLAFDAKGENGWGIDKIFIPQGYDKTLAEFTEEDQVNVWNTHRWESLISYLKTNL